MVLSRPATSCARLRPSPCDNHSHDDHADRNADNPSDDGSETAGASGGREPVRLAFQPGERGGENRLGSTRLCAGARKDELDRLGTERYLRRIDDNGRARLDGVGADDVDVESLPLLRREPGAGREISRCEMLLTECAVHALHAQHEANVVGPTVDDIGLAAAGRECREPLRQRKPVTELRVAGDLQEQRDDGENAGHTTDLGSASGRPNASATPGYTTLPSTTFSPRNRLASCLQEAFQPRRASFLA